MQNDQKLRLY